MDLIAYVLEGGNTLYQKGINDVKQISEGEYRIVPENPQGAWHVQVTPRTENELPYPVVAVVRVSAVGEIFVYIFDTIGNRRNHGFSIEATGA